MGTTTAGGRLLQNVSSKIAMALAVALSSISGAEINNFVAPFYFPGDISIKTRFLFPSSRLPRVTLKVSP